MKKSLFVPVVLQFDLTATGIFDRELEGNLSNRQNRRYFDPKLAKLKHL